MDNNVENLFDQGLDCFIGRGEVWQSKGHSKSALADFRKAIEIEPDNLDYQKLVDQLSGKSD
jgi:hypothetical protein